jgi:predicted 3-demethylubiquinone-9 3-methyltransferase (glyoxalase superfamily)
MAFGDMEHDRARLEQGEIAVLIGRNLPERMQRKMGGVLHRRERHEADVEGQRFHALNGGPQYRFTEAVSFFISVETQAEVDYFWSRLTADGGEESSCGWLKDKFGLSWQVIPSALGRYLGDPDRTRANRVMQAMLQMQKIVIADLDKAYAG